MAQAMMDDPLPFRANIRELALFDHGLSVDDVRRLSGRDDVLNLAGNENAVGASPRVADAVRAEADTAWLYPDPAYARLVDALAAKLDLDRARISLGTGSEALLAIIARAAIEPGDRIVSASPTFPVYASLALSQGGQLVDVPRLADHGLDMPAMAAALERPAKIVFLCNPNNPTGTPIPPAQISAIARMVGPRGLVVLDEAYHEFHALEDPLGSIRSLEAGNAPWFVLRTFSKAYALGGFRVGYAIARDAALTAMIDRVRPQFGVGSLSERAALAALADQSHLEAAVLEIRAARDMLREGLIRLGFDVARSSANFLFVKGPADLADRLARQAILVRPAPGGAVRLTVCRARDVPRVIEAFRSAADA